MIIYEGSTNTGLLINCWTTKEHIKLKWVDSFYSLDTWFSFVVIMVMYLRSLFDEIDFHWRCVYSHLNAEYRHRTSFTCPFKHLYLKQKTKILHCEAICKHFVSILHVNNIPTMHFKPGNPWVTYLNSYAMLFTECSWEFQMMHCGLPVLFIKLLIA